MNEVYRRSSQSLLEWLVLPAMLGLFLTACPPADEPVEEATPEAKADPPAVRTDLSELAASRSLVPSPTEIQEAMMQAGVSIRFDKLIKRRDLKLKDDAKDLVALRCGIVLADLVLTINHSEKDALLKDLESLRTGLATIGAGEDVERTLAGIGEHVEADAVSRQELWVQVEEMREAAYGELEHEAGSRMVPLVQAGSWLEATDLLCQAIQNSEQAGAAPNLLRQPQVVKYFLNRIKAGTGDEGELSPLLTLARGTLEQIHDIATKEELTVEDVRRIHGLTSDLLGKL